MKFNKIKISNFLSIGEMDLSLSYGLYLINGWNHDKQTHNGSGKSAILDALCWGLFGEIPRNIAKDSIINWQKASKCSVILIIEDNKTIYRIERSRKPNVLSFYINDKISNGIDVIETQAIIESTLDITYNLFNNSVYFSQNSHLQFLTANDSDKKEVFTQLLQLYIFDKSFVLIKDDLKQLEDSRKDLTSRYEINFNSYNLKLAQMKEYELLSKQFLIKSQKLKEDTKREIDRILKKKEELSELHSINLKEKEDLINRNTNNLRKLDESLLLLLDDINWHKEIISQNIIKCNEKIKKISDYKLSLNKLTNDLSNKLTSLNDKKDLLKQQVQERIEAIKRLELTEEGICKSCFQKISKDKLLEQILEYKKEVYSISIEFKKFNEQQSLLSKDLEEVTLSGQKTIQEEEQSLKAYQDENRAYQSRLEQLQKDYEEKKQEKSELVTHIETQRFELKFLTKEKDIRINDLEDKLTEKQKELLDIEQQENPYIQLHTKVLAKLKEHGEEEDKIKHQITEVVNKIHELEFLKKGFSDTGIKAYIFERIVKELTLISNEYLSYLFDTDISIEFKVKDTRNKKEEITHKFETHININNTSKEFGSFSGGEKRRLILAVDLALSRLIQNRTNRSFSLIIFDEYFEGLDNIGKEKFLDLLKNFEKTTILVIDHNTQFQNLFDITLRVEKKDGITQIC